MNDVQPPQEEVKKERLLTRQEQRFFEKVSQEAQRVLGNTVNRFVQFMANEDLTEASIKEKRDALSRQWKTYCTIKHLNIAAFDAVAKECDQIIEVYNSQKADGAPENNGSSDSQGE